MESVPIRIIEFNSFGYWLAAGSCLFHWLDDAEILKGPTQRSAVSAPAKPLNLVQQSVVQSPKSVGKAKNMVEHGTEEHGEAPITFRVLQIPAKN